MAVNDFDRIPLDALPLQMAVSAVTMAGLAAGARHQLAMKLDVCGARIGCSA